jgi:hypothetical protein
MSVGHLLNDGLKLEGSSSSLEFLAGTSSTKAAVDAVQASLPRPKYLLA